MTNKKCEETQKICDEMSKKVFKLLYKTAEKIEHSPDLNDQVFLRSLLALQAMLFDSWGMNAMAGGLSEVQVLETFQNVLNKVMTRLRQKGLK